MSKGRIYFNNQHVGSLTKNVDASFWLDYLPEAKPVSWTLPLSQTTYTSAELFPFFDGLIPEGWLLNLVQKNWKISKTDRMALLLATCQDCIGAAHVLDKNHAGIDQEGSVKKNSKTNLQKTTGVTPTSDRCLICLVDLKHQGPLYHKKCALNLFGFSHTPIVDISTDDLDKLALMQINQRQTLTGVQKKLSLSYTHDVKKERLTVVGLDGRFILKPSTTEYPEMAEIEHLCMKLAGLQKIPMAECGLIYLSSGERAYITRRFDRVENEKIQVEDFCQLSDKSTARKYDGSSEALGKVIDKYSAQPQDDKLTLFEMILFSFWIGNADMHLKNFSLWKDPHSQLVRMSPGYDFLSTRLLISINEDKEELALPINGRKNKLKWRDFLSFGNNLKIPVNVMERVRERMLDSFFDADDLISRSFLSDQKKQAISNLLIERTKRISNQ